MRGSLRRLWLLELVASLMPYGLVLFLLFVDGDLYFDRAIGRYELVFAACLVAIITYVDLQDHGLHAKGLELLYIALLGCVVFTLLFLINNKPNEFSYLRTSRSFLSWSGLFLFFGAVVSCLFHQGAIERSRGNRYTW